MLAYAVVMPSSPNCMRGGDSGSNKTVSAVRDSSLNLSELSGGLYY